GKPSVTPFCRQRKLLAPPICAMPCPMPLQPWHVICDHVGRAGLSRAVAYPVERRCRSPRTAGLLKRNDSPKRSFLTTKTVVSRAKRSKHRFSETKCETDRETIFLQVVLSKG